jgi:histidyl-tRNA synthetase
MSTKPPSGTRDFLPDDVRRREHVVGVVRRVYERYGFEPLETPAFENIDTLLGKYGEEGNRLIFKILRRGEQEGGGEADLALRYDLTVPLARVVAQYQNVLPRLFKRYQVQPVWRADRPGRGRFREFYQCDIDAVGSSSPVVEAELLGAAAEVLSELGFADFWIRLNHRRALTALLESAGIAPELHAEALVSLDKLDKIGAAGVEQELRTRGVEASGAASCLELFAKSGAGDAGPRGTLGALRGFLRDSEAGLIAVGEMDEIVRLADETAARGKVRVDASLARGLSYYTGAIMEIAVADLPGSLAGGGRYDNLVGMFLGRDVPACGFSLGLERIIVVMGERGMFPAALAAGPADVMVTMWNDACRGDALSLARQLRSGGLRVDLYPDSDKLARQFKYASSRHVPFVAVLGDDERAAGAVTVKNMRSGVQETVSRGGVVEHLARQLPMGEDPS